MTVPPSIEFFFDPACPWTWMTSRWLVDAAGQTGTSIQWRNLSLMVINSDREIPEKYQAAVRAAQATHRIIAALGADERNDLAGAVYTEWGRRFHHDRVESNDELAPAVAETAGAGEWASAAHDDRWDEVIEASTKEGQQLAGGDVGSPVLVFGEPRRGVFGPIVSPPPSGDEAAALLEHVVAAAMMPSFFELKRGRQGGPRLGPRP